VQPINQGDAGPMRNSNVDPARAAPKHRRLACRRFSAIDGMIVLAASAGGLVMARTWLQATSDMNPLGLSPFNARIIAASWVLVALTIAVIPIRFVKPRPSLKRIVGQPGFQASIAACVVVVIHVFAAGYSLLPPLKSPADFFLSVQPLFFTGPAVATVWVILALGGGWRAEPSWIDRCGRWLGWTWVIGYFVDMVFL